MKKNSKIFVAGHKGLAGSAVLRKLTEQNYSNLVLRTHQELDLENQADVQTFFERERPEYVFLAAAKVGGIHANNVYRADFLIKNLKIQNNVIESAYRFDSKKLLFLGSSCIYPKLAPQPLKEEYLLTGLLEPTNEPYAIAKIAGIKLCESYNRQYGTDFISAMPTNLYGPNDNFDLNNSHVLPALIRKFVEARDRNAPEVIIWGTGTPLREFLHVDDLADALIFLMMHYSGNEFVNVGTGREISILDLAHCIKRLTGYSGKLEFDSSKPDGTPRKVMDISKLNAMGWYPKISLDTGLKQTIDWYEKHV